MEHIASKISDSELEVLSVLWEADGPLSLAEIRQELERARSWDASTIKTLARRLCEKGAVQAEKQGVYRYRPLITREDYRAWSTNNLIDRLFRGSARQLVASLVEGDQLTAADVRELLDMLGEGANHG